MCTCERALELISLGLDGEWKEEERQELEEHLAHCGDCRALARELEEAHVLLSELGEEEVPEGFRAAVMDRVRAEKTVPFPQHTPAGRRTRPWKRWASLAAVFAVVLLGAGWYLYAAAKRRFAAWDGEDEDAMDAAEQQLSWALLLTGLVIILDFFFFAASIIYDRFLPDLILFLASVAVLVVLQQKIVDLERRINPEKRGSVYDMKFQKTWMDSCDEAERAQIGQACYRAYMVGTKVCIFLWVALLILNFVFDFGLLPIAAVLAVWGAMQTVYALECIRLSKRTGDA